MVKRRIAPLGAPRSVAAVLALAGCTAVPAPPDAVPLRSTVLAGTARPVLQAVGPGRTGATLLVRPGFTRRCEHLAGTLRALARDTLWQVQCLQPEPGDGAGLADLAHHLAAQRQPLLLAGHSAGAAWAAALAAEAVRAGAPVAGLLMLDPVPAAGFDAALATLVAHAVPLRAWVAPRQACNAQGAARALLAARGATPVEAPPGATHADAEGEDTDALAAWACGPPQSAPVQALRRWLTATAAALAPSSAGPARPAPTAPGSTGTAPREPP